MGEVAPTASDNAGLAPPTAFVRCDRSFASDLDAASRFGSDDLLLLASFHYCPNVGMALERTGQGQRFSQVKSEADRTRASHVRQCEPGRCRVSDIKVRRALAGGN